MTTPTKQSLDEAAQAIDRADWASVLSEDTQAVQKSVTAHALTLDRLHGRMEISEAQEFLAALLDAWDAPSVDDNIRRGELDDCDKAAIALIEAKFAELLARTPQEPEWKEHHGGECPVPAGSDCEVRFRNGNTSRNNMPEWWDWGKCGSGAITHYREWPARQALGQPE